MYIDEFETYLRTETHLKEGTIQNYVSTSKSFSETYDNLIEVDLKLAIRDYLLESMDRLELSTVNTNLTALKRYILFLLVFYPEEIGDYNMLYFPKKRKEEKLPKFLDDYQMQQIQLVIDNTDKFDPVGQFVIRLMMNHGMSPKEMLNMKVDNIDFQKGMVLYRDRDDGLLRMMILIKSDFEWFIKYLNSSDYNIDNPSILQLETKTIKRHHIQKYCKELGQLTNLKLNPTIFRNTFIRQCLGNGMSELYIQLYMGFKSINSVARYQSINFTRILEGSLYYIEKLRGMMSDTTEQSQKTKSDVIKIYREVQENALPEYEEPLVDLS